jgi:RNA polymerase sigma-70 factor, ECF subfamily
VTFAQSTAEPPPRTAAPPLAELFRQHGRFVWRVVASYGVKPADVEDAAQEVFLTAHRLLQTTDWNEVNPRSWLYSIARRVAANHRRRALRSREVVHADARPESIAPDPTASIDRDRMLERLHGALDGLTEAKRDVFILFEIQELSMAEVAEVVGCPVQTAYARLYAARRELAGVLEEGER